MGRPDQSLIPILEVVCLNQQTSGSNEFQKCENYLGQPGRFHKIHIVPMLHNIRINYINTMSQPKPEQPQSQTKNPNPRRTRFVGGWGPCSRWPPFIAVLPKSQGLVEQGKGRKGQKRLPSPQALKCWESLGPPLRTTVDAK